MSLFSYPIDSAWFFRKKRVNKTTLQNDGKFKIKVKIAVLSGSTTAEIVDALELFLLDYGIDPIFFTGEFGNYWQDAMFPSDDFLNFKPDIIYIHTTLRNLLEFPKIDMGYAEIDALLNNSFNRFEAMWNNLFSVFKCTVIQNNFETPYYRLLGNKDFYDRRGRLNFVNRLNNLFCGYAEKNDRFLISDINFIASSYGLEKWSDPQYWNLYKYAMSVSAIPEFSYNLANIIKAVYGQNKKAVAVDLDNTLWGGIIADDGQEGIQLGQDLSLGQAYLEFQEYIKYYKDLGIFLTINSKNDAENALLGLNHPDTVLIPEDFAVIKANWENKSDNIDQIASTLNIFPDSIVFLDDNPAEREQVKGSIGGIAAPELNSVENYIRVVDRNAYFEFISLSDDDKKRNEMFLQNQERAAQITAYKSYGEYLQSLEMSAKITCFKPVDYQRIVQLTNKSNTFNLTSKRYSLPDIEAVSVSEEYITLCGRLADKFGDNGIVSLIIGKINNDELYIDLWLMSCRVLKRGMEYAMLDCLVSECKKKNIIKINGFYYKTVKNSMVSNLYEQFGFILTDEKANGDSNWIFNIKDYKNKSKDILINGENNNEPK